MSKSYRVVWEIDIEADSPEEAARIALDIQRDDSSQATCFAIKDESGKETVIDIDEIDIAREVQP